MRFFSCVTVLAISCTLSATAWAGDHAPGHSLNSVGRWLGYGWSRGYHSQDGCNNCSTNNPSAIPTRYFEAITNPDHQHQPADEQPHPLLQPATNNLPTPKAVPSQPKSVLPSPKSSPPAVEGPKADDARFWQRSAYPLRANRALSQPYSR